LGFVKKFILITVFNVLALMKQYSFWIPTSPINVFQFEVICNLNTGFCQKIASDNNFESVGFDYMKYQFWILIFVTKRSLKVIWKQIWPLIFILRAMFFIMTYEFYFRFRDEKMCRIHDYIKTNLATDIYF
jgi:hypothetical protein